LLIFTIWGTAVKYIVRCSSVGIFLLFFFMITLVLWVLERKTTEVKCHIHHVLSRVHPINVTHNCGWWLSLLDYGCIFQVFFPLKLFLLTFSKLFSEKTSLYYPQWGDDTYTIYL
jgi:hypothetical protein